MTEDLRGRLTDAFLERVPAATLAARQIAIDALSELVEFKTPLFDDWWARNHYRYMKMREDERRAVRIPLREFVGEVQLGKAGVA